VALAAAIAAGCIGLFFWYFQFFLAARRLVREQPVVAEIPSALPDQTISTAPGMSLSYLGYSFEVPWVDIDQASVQTRNNTAVIPFRSGATIVLMRHSPGEMLEVLEKPSPTEMHRRLCALYGDYGCESDYQLMNLAFATRPDELGWFTPRDKDARGLALLTLKMIYITDPSGLFSIETKEFKGFQIGDITKGKRRAVDDLYSDGGKVEFVFGGKPTQGGAISQPEINRVLQTLHKISAAPTAN